MKKRILIVSRGWFHPSWQARRLLARILREMDGIRLHHRSTLEGLLRLGEYQAVVLYIHGKRLSAPALAALQAFVAGGGGLLALHSATASFMDSPGYFEILGGRFASHGPIHEFEVKPVEGSALFSGIPGFSVTDELYLHEMQPGIEIHYTTQFEGQSIPVIWTNIFGAGRVCYASPGHRSQTLANPIYQRVLRRGLSWTLENSAE